MNVLLKDAADIVSGYQFRGKIPEISNGSVNAVQMRNVNALLGIDWNGVTRTELLKSVPSMWLEDGDILFAARGANNFAVVAASCPPRTVLSPHFFHIRVRDKERLLPDFLAWQINQSPMQKFFRKSSEGSDVVGIRKAVLERAEVVVPSLDEQRRVVNMIECWGRERLAIDALAKNHMDLMAGIAEVVLNRNSEGEEKSS